jgi:hypothetical protein
LWRDWKCIDRYAAQGFAAAKDIFLILGWMGWFSPVSIGGQDLRALTLRHFDR